MRCRALLVFLLIGLPLAAAARPPAVVTSIAPLHSLVSALMEDVATPQLLLPANASPHAYAMKPSQARALNDADLVFWIGPSLETFLGKPLRALGGRARVLAMQDMPGIRTLPLRAGGLWETADADHDHHEDEEHAAHEAAFDPHLWLDPANARAFTAAAVEALVAADPDNAAVYQRNHDRLRQALDELDGELKASLKAVAGRRFLVFHDAFQYFEARYGLAGVGSVTVAADRQPGARRIAELRQRISESGVTCVFREPQFSPRLIQPVIEGLPVRVGILDPLGGELAGGPQHYLSMMRALGRAIRDCLAAG